MSNYAVRALTFNYPTARTYDFVFTFTCDKKVAANSHEVFVEKCEIGDFAVFFFLIAVVSRKSFGSYESHGNHARKKVTKLYSRERGFPTRLPGPQQTRCPGEPHCGTQEITENATVFSWPFNVKT